MPNLDSDGDAAALAEFQEELAKAGKKESDAAGPPESVVVDLDDDDDDDDDSGDDGRRQRRAQRPSLMRALEEERAERERLAREVESLKAAQSRQPPPTPPPAEEKDPYQEKIDALGSQMETTRAAYYAEYRAADGKLEPGREAHFQKEFSRLANERQELAVERTVERRLRERQGAQDANTQRALLQSQFPKVFADPKAEMWAGGRYRQLIGEGREPNQQTMVEALRDAESHFKLGSPPRSERERERNRGQGRGGQRASATSRRSVTLTRDQQRMALATYQHRRDLSDAQKFKLFVKDGYAD